MENKRLTRIHEKLLLLGVCLLIIINCQRTPTDNIVLPKATTVQARTNYDTIEFIAHDSIFYIPSEDDLLLDSAGWISIEGIPFQVDEIEKINLGGIGFNNGDIKTFPNEILKFRNLKYLYLGMRGFETVPAEITQLSKLETLDFQHGWIKRFPPEFAELKQLQELTLLFSAIEELPDNFYKLTGLRMLHLGCTGFSEIPPPLFRMKQLKVLYIFHCDEEGKAFSQEEIQRLRDSLPTTQVFLGGH